MEKSNLKLNINELKCYHWQITHNQNSIRLKHESVGLENILRNGIKHFENVKFKWKQLNRRRHQQQIKKNNFNGIWSRMNIKPFEGEMRNSKMK